MKRIADYEFVRELGAGNHGRYYLARTPRRLGIRDEHCAVKVLATQASGDAFKRMVNELKLFASAKSPYLARLLDAGHEDGTLYYAAEYYPRGSLAEAIGTGPRRVAPAEAVRAVADAALGAHALHELGVAHRDIKPANILLTDSGAVLADLGLAQRLSPGATVTGIGPIGTLAYMEPGVARGLPAGRASDIWALAASLQVALTGVDPYPRLPSSNLVDALRHLLSTPPTVTVTDPVLGPLVRWGLAAERTERPPTAEAYARALREAVAG